MKNPPVLQVSNLKKRFKIFPTPWSILKEWMTLGKRSYHTDYWALKGVSFDVSPGEFVGIIGPNGAGKSTLLRIITDVLQPTEGTYNANGRLLSILELSGGTDQELTGRENVIRSGQLLGFPDGYVDERIERIKEFSELGDFFEQPLRMYSTGMKTRLSFSMFAFMDTDILILDEVLAVGDIFFKQKCFARLSELIEQKTAIILVTHSMGIIQRYCDRVILLNEGEKLFDGEPGEAIRLYLQLRGDKQAEMIRRLGLDQEESDFLQPSQGRKTYSIARPQDWPPESAFRLTTFPTFRGKGRAELHRLAVLNDRGEPTLSFKQGDWIHIFCEFSPKQDIGSPVVNVEIRDKFNLLIHAKNAVQNRAELPVSISKGDFVHYHQSIKLDIAPGSYVFNLDCSIALLGKSDRPQNAKSSGLKDRASSLWRLERAFAVVVQPRFGEGVGSLYGGLCDLPGESILKVTPGNV